MYGADALAKYGAGAGLPFPALWSNDAPDFVQNLIASDAAVLFG